MTKWTDKIDSMMRFFLYGLMLAIPLSVAGVEICLSACVFLWVIKHGFLAAEAMAKEASWSAKMRQFFSCFRVKVTVMNWSIAIFLLVCILSSFFGVSPGKSLLKFLTKTLGWFFVFFSVVEVFTERKHFQMALRVLFITTAIIIWDGFLQYFVTGKDLIAGRVMSPGRATATFKAPNGLGSFLMQSLPLLWVYIMREGKKRFWVLSVVVGLGLWLLILTFSRGAWLALILAVIIAVVWSINFRGKIFRKLFLKFFVLLILSSAAIVSYSQMGREHIIDWNTAEHRLTMWQDSLKMVKARPVLGYGINTFMKEFQKHRRDPARYPAYAHNCYLQILVETGVLGLSAFLWMMATFFYHINRLKHIVEVDFSLQVLLVGIFISLVGLYIQSFVDTNLYSLQLAALWWYVMGMGMALFNMVNSQRGLDYGRK